MSEEQFKRLEQHLIMLNANLLILNETLERIRITYGVRHL